MIKRTLESKPEYGIVVSITPLRNPATREVESWRIHGVSRKLKFGELSEASHHAVVGWIYSLSRYFMSDLKSFAYRL